MISPWLSAQLISIQPVGKRIRIFRFLLLDAPSDFTFIGGQFLTFDLPIGDKRQQRWRSYSIASHVKQLPEFELAISRMEGGKASTYFFENIVVGDLIKCKGPEGNFVLPTSSPGTLVCIATGSGVVPYRSMIQDWIQLSKPYPLHLIYGTRLFEDVLFFEEFKQIALEHSEFKLDIVLSRESEWDGTKGYVHPVYLDAYRDQSEDVLFYICGWQKMIDETVSNLIRDLGCRRTQIKYELYG